MTDRKKRVQRKVVIALITSALLHFTAARVQAEDSAPENQSKEAATAAIPESTLKLKLIGTYLADPIEQSVAIIRIDGNPAPLFASTETRKFSSKSAMKSSKKCCSQK